MEKSSDGFRCITVAVAGLAVGMGLDLNISYCPFPIAHFLLSIEWCRRAFNGQSAMGNRQFYHFGAATLSITLWSTRAVALASPVCRYVLLMTRWAHTGPNSDFTSSGVT